MKKLFQAKVVVKKLAQTDEGYLLAWRRCNDEGRWLSNTETGSLSDLQTRLTPQETDICLVIPGTDVVCQSVSFNKKEKKHLSKIIPYELEDDLTEEVEDLHFAYGVIGEEAGVAAYTQLDDLQQCLNAFSEAGLSVNHCVPEPLLIERFENGWAIRLDDYLHVHYGEGLGFSVDVSLAKAALASLSNQSQPEHVLLLAEDQTQLEALRQLLPLDLTQHLVEEQIDTKIVDGWESLALNNVHELELRQGQFAPQLPIATWWKDWRGVAIMTSIAVAIFLGLNIAQMQINKAQDLRVRQEMVQVYRQVIPQGATTNMEKILEQRLDAYQNTSSGGSVVAMLAKVAPMLAKKEEINLQNLRYDDQRGTMDLTLTAKSSSDAIELSDAIQGTGLSAKLAGVTDIGDEQQVRMTISRAAQ